MAYEKFILLTKQEYTIGCAAGQGAACCRFLVAGADGIECARNTVFHDQLVARGDTMVAQRTPTAPYPQCQLHRCKCGKGFDTDGDGNCPECFRKKIA
jgi:hypothetical protein